MEIDTVLAELIPDYMESRRADVQSIQRALVENDFETITILGHSMKGSGGGYGFDRITSIGSSISVSVRELDEYLSNVQIVYPTSRFNAVRNECQPW